MAVKFACLTCRRDLVFKYLCIGEQYKCPYCGKVGTVPTTATEVVDAQVVDASLSIEKAMKGDSGSARVAAGETIQAQHLTQVKSPLIGLLSFFAWFNFIVGIIGSLVVADWLKWSKEGILIGIGLILESVLALIICLAICMIARIVIANHTALSKLNDKERR